MKKKPQHHKITTKTKQSDRPGWAWWGGTPERLNARHAVRILGRAAGLEAVVFQPGGPPLDRAVQRYQRANPRMGRNDRAVLAEAVYGLARNRNLLRAALPEAVPGEGDLLLLALLDRLGTGAPGKVPHLPEGVRPWLAALDRVKTLRAGWVRSLKAAWRTEPGRCAPGARDAWEGLMGVPGWWLDRGPWATLGEAVREVAELRKPQGLTLRAQPHRGPRDRAVDLLRQLDIPAAPTYRSPWGVRVAGRHNVLGTDPYRSGIVEVQDEGSQLVAVLCDPKPGERILDLCAGGGGKSLALASAMGGRGLVVAHDVHSGRLADTRRRARRAGLGNVRVEPDPGRLGGHGPFDLVLVDAPCSSTGTLRRNPDVAWRWQEEDVVRLAALQDELLDRAAALVRPGGFLVYATCSVLRTENGERVTALLGRRPDLAPAPPGDRLGHGPLADVPGADTGAFRVPSHLPRYEGDGFFMARLRKRG